MTPDEAKEAAALVKSYEELVDILAFDLEAEVERPEDKVECGQITLCSGVSESGHTTQSSAFLPTWLTLELALVAQDRVAARLKDLGVKTP